MFCYKFSIANEILLFIEAKTNPFFVLEYIANFLRDFFAIGIFENTVHPLLDKSLQQLPNFP